VTAGQGVTSLASEGSRKPLNNTSSHSGASTPTMIT
jgi:hypothetical protein